MKDQNSDYGIPLDFQKRSSKIRENFVSNLQLNDIKDYDVTIDLQKKSFTEMLNIVLTDWILHYKRISCLET